MRTSKTFAILAHSQLSALQVGKVIDPTMPDGKSLLEGYFREAQRDALLHIKELSAQPNDAHQGSFTRLLDAEIEKLK